jgi:hypothetical protein
VPPGSPEDFAGYAVEILGKGCQFAAYGWRDDHTEYTWPEESLLDAQYMDLPVITLAQAEAIKDYAAAFFERNGLERRSPGGGTDEGYSHVYDLTPDMIFDVHDLGRVSVADLTRILQESPDDVLRAKADTFRTTSGSCACMISLSGGNLCVSDHGTYTSHFPVEMDTSIAANSLGQLLAARFPEKPPTIIAPNEVGINFTTTDLDPLDPLDVNLALALTRYVYNKQTNTIHDSADIDMTPMDKEHFSTFAAPFYKTEQGSKGGEKTTRLVDLFLQHPKRLMVESAQMRPDKPQPAFRDNGKLHLNTYRTLELPTSGDSAIGWAFLEHLLPIEPERKFFTQWLAHKLLHPDVRGPGIVMVAHDEYGTGRGSLVALIRSMFANNLVSEIDFKTLAGTTYQSQYNDWLEKHLIVAVSEAQETAANQSRWQTRSNAYERLKEVIDPAATHFNAVRKGISNGASRTFCSIMVMTNHMDSVVLPANDRRLAILENGGTQPPEYWTAFHAWREDLSNVGAFVAELKKFDLTGYSAYEAPPMTAAKADMVEAGSSELDRLAAEALSKFRNTVLVKEQVILEIEHLLAESSVEVPDDWQAITARIFLRSTRKITALNDRVKIDGKTRTVRMIGRPDPAVFTSPDTLLKQVLASGAVTRSVRSSGAVVAFPSRR